MAKKLNIRDRIKEFRRIKPEELLDHQKNWRTHPEAQQGALKGVLQEIGIAGALTAYYSARNNGKLTLIDGHLRKATESVEWPTLILDVDDAEADLLLATLDPLSAIAGTNAEALDDLLRGVETGNAELMAFLDELAQKNGIVPGPDGPSGETDHDAEPQIDQAAELQKKWKTETGQLWLIGEHRLLCGDSTKREDVERVMGGDVLLLVSTDPPYGVDFAGAKYNPRAKEWAGIDGDNRQGRDLREWLAGMWGIWLDFCSEQASFYSWCAAMEEGTAAAALRDAGIHVQSQIIWNKNCLVLGQADYQWKHENCWYGFLKGKKHRWFGGRAQTTVWEISKVANSEYIHPMQKPLELYAIPIRNHTMVGDCIGEPFAGSGTQLVAAQNLNRKCRAIEISPGYVAVILERMKTAFPEIKIELEGQTKAKPSKAR